MFFLTIIRDYIFWHYTTALISFIRLYKNFWWFIVQFFSISQLTSSLFAPYKRLTERRGRLFDIEAWIGFIAINLISRLLGFFIRLIIIVCGICSLVGLCVTAVILYGLWLSVPLLLLYCLLYGGYLLF